MRFCKLCKTEKEEGEFGKCARMPDGKKRDCKACLKARQAAWINKPGHREKFNSRVREWRKNSENREMMNTRAKNWREQNPEKLREINARNHLKRNYGITLEQKTNMVAAQEGCCAICGCEFESSSDTNVDHLHGSSPIRVRGILCSACNVGLGNFKDSERVLRRAVLYLQKFGG